MIDREKLYHRLRSVIDIERADFEDDCDDVIRELCAICGRKNVYVTETHEEVYEEYEGAIASAILYRARREEKDYSDFESRLKYAFAEVWRQRARKAIRKGENA